MAGESLVTRAILIGNVSLSYIPYHPPHAVSEVADTRESSTYTSTSISYFSIPRQALDLSPNFPAELLFSALHDNIQHVAFHSKILLEICGSSFHSMV